MVKFFITAVVILAVAGGLYYFGNLPKLNRQQPKKIEIVDNNKEEIVITSGIVVGTVESDLGEYLTDTKGRTLYAFSEDKEMESVCSGECLSKWPIFEYDNKYLQGQLDYLSSRMNVIQRKDGYSQYAYGKIPLYYYVGDKNPGDTNGISDENIGSRWSLIFIKK